MSTSIIIIYTLKFPFLLILSKTERIGQSFAEKFPLTTDGFDAIINDECVGVGAAVSSTVPDFLKREELTL